MTGGLGATPERLGPTMEHDGAERSNEAREGAEKKCDRRLETVRMFRLSFPHDP